MDQFLIIRDWSPIIHRYQMINQITFFLIILLNIYRCNVYEGGNDSSVSLTSTSNIRTRGEYVRGVSQKESDVKFVCVPCTVTVTRQQRLNGIKLHFSIRNRKKNKEGKKERKSVRDKGWEMMNNGWHCVYLTLCQCVNKSDWNSTLSISPRQTNGSVSQTVLMRTRSWKKKNIVLLLKLSSYQWNLSRGLMSKF